MLVPALALLLAALLTMFERAWPARPEPAQRRLNLAIWSLRLLVGLAVLPRLSAAATAVGRAAGLPGLHLADWPPLLGWVGFFLLMDLGEYLFHRAQHAWPLLWRLHAVHHSDPCVNATTTERHWWGDGLIKAVTIWPVVLLIAQPTPAMGGAWVLASLYNYLAHANLPLSFGRWSFVLNSPAYHRLHHARAEADHGANFAALFPIYDVIFGSYRRPKGFAATGLDGPPRGLAWALWPLRS